MLQGPLGLNDCTGMISTRISYSNRSTLHDLVLPETEPATPQVAYTPTAADLPQFTGHPVIGQDSLSYYSSWLHYFIFSVRNYGSTALTVYCKPRAYDTTYQTLSLSASPMSNSVLATMVGLYQPGLGNEEAFKLYCPGGGGNIRLYKSCFAIMPNKFLTGPLKNIYDMRVLSTTQSVFGETVSSTDNMAINVYNARSAPVEADDTTFPAIYCKNTYQNVFSLSFVYSMSASSSNMNQVLHHQPRYPTAILYRMKPR